MKKPVGKARFGFGKSARVSTVKRFDVISVDLEELVALVESETDLNRTGPVVDFTLQQVEEGDVKGVNLGDLAKELFKLCGRENGGIRMLDGELFEGRKVVCHDARQSCHETRLC